MILTDLPREILLHIFRGLKTNTQRLLLGKTCRYAHELYLEFNEFLKTRIQRNRWWLSKAVRYGDPILTQVIINPKKINQKLFLMACLSGNIAVVKWLDTCLVVCNRSSSERELKRTLVNQYIKTLLNVLRFTRFKPWKVSQVSIEDICTYVWNQTNMIEMQVELLRNLAGVITVYGENTVLYSHLDVMIRHISIVQRPTIHRRVLFEYIYAGEIDEAIHYQGEFRHAGASFSSYTLLCAAIDCPIEDVDTYLRCLYRVISTIQQTVSRRTWRKENKKAMHMFLRQAITRGEFALDVIEEWIKECHIFDADRHTIDYERVWVNAFCERGLCIRRWNLDMKKCLLLILEYIYRRHRYAPRISIISKTLDNFLKYVPDAFHLLDIQEIERHQISGVFCPKCLRTKLRFKIVKADTPDIPDRRRKMYKCDYCTYLYSFEYDVPSSSDSFPPAWRPIVRSEPRE